MVEGREGVDREAQGSVEGMGPHSPLRQLVEASASHSWYERMSHLRYAHLPATVPRPHQAAVLVLVLSQHARLPNTG